MKNKQFYDSFFANKYHLNWDDAPGKLVILNYLSDIEEPIENILDLGCGSGYLANAIKEILPSVNIVGLDISDIAIQEAKIKYPELRFVKGDAEIFKLKTKFDVIVSYGVLEHLSDPFKGVLQVSSHLKPNGKIAMLMPTIPYYRSDRYDEGYYEDLNIPPQMQWNFERVKWEVMFEKAGIELYSINFSEKYGAIKPGNFYFGVKS